MRRFRPLPLGAALLADVASPEAPTWVADAGQGTKPPAFVVGDAVFVAGGNSSSFSVLDAATGAVLHAPPVPRLPAVVPHGGLRPCGGRASCAKWG